MEYLSDDERYSLLFSFLYSLIVDAEVISMRRFGFYEYSCLIWCINVVLIVLSHFISGLIYTALIFEIAVVFLCVIMFRLEKKKEKFLAK